MKPKPYIGITGFKSEKDVVFAGLQYQLQGLPREDCTAMFGIISSEKRMNSKHTAGKQSPAVQDISRLMKYMPKWSLPMIHYCQQSPHNFYDNVIELMSENSIPGLQLNIAWPSVKEIEALKSNLDDFVYTFQIPKRALENTSHQELRQKICEYQEVADYVLLDPSSGKGLEFDVDESKDILLLAQECLPYSRLGIAGGLNNRNVFHKLTLLEDLGTLSFDAQSGVMLNNELLEEFYTPYIEEGMRYLNEQALKQYVS